MSRSLCTVLAQSPCSSTLLTSGASRCRFLSRPLSTSTSTTPPPAAGPSKRVIFSGIQPSGTIHLGNHLGALSNWVQLQNTAPPEDEIYYSIVGLHAITIPKDPTTLRKERLDMLASLLAVGINPERCVLFHQDMVAEHAELAWILNCITPMGKLQLMTTWKSKIRDHKNASSEADISESDLHLGLFAYPVLQAADVLLYKATHIPVGEDQQQHLELARVIANSFNHRFGKKTFPLPQHMITPSKRILSLRDPTSKMSKSSPVVASRILITDSASTIQSKLRSSITDSVPGPLTFSPSTRPGVANLLTILAACTARTPEACADEYQHLRLGEFKGLVADAVEATLGPVRERYERLKGEDGYLSEVGRKGADKAREKARVVLKEVKEKVGLGDI